MLDYYCAKLMEAHAHWLNISENGCNDPGYPDGTNMNLVRNHTIYYRKKILFLAEYMGTSIPDCYYEPVPPKVDNNYMANLNPKDEQQKKRVENLSMTEKVLTNKKPDSYLTMQFSFI